MKKINDVKNENKGTSVQHLDLLKKLETLADNTEDALEKSESEKSAHRTEMKNLMNNVKTKVHSTSLNHADHAAWAMAAIAGIFQGIGLADSFFAGRNQKSEVETMVRESLYYQEKAAGVHPHSLAQTDTYATKPGTDVHEFPLWVALTNLGCTVIGGFLANKYIRYTNDKDKWAALALEAKEGGDITEWYHARIMKDKEMSGESVDEYLAKKVAETKYLHTWMMSPKEKAKTNTKKPAATQPDQVSGSKPQPDQVSGSKTPLEVPPIPSLHAPLPEVALRPPPRPITDPPTTTPESGNFAKTFAQTSVSDDATYAAIAF